MVSFWGPCLGLGWLYSRSRKKRVCFVCVGEHVWGMDLDFMDIEICLSMSWNEYKHVPSLEQMILLGNDSKKSIYLRYHNSLLLVTVYPI